MQNVKNSNITFNGFISSKIEAKGLEISSNLRQLSETQNKSPWKIVCEQYGLDCNAAKIADIVRLSGKNSWADVLKTF